MYINRREVDYSAQYEELLEMNEEQLKDTLDQMGFHIEDAQTQPVNLEDEMEGILEELLNNGRELR